ncbi:MAG: iron-containing alcohol dehydrogenase, partial [Spirochaetia bacterium]|nr:iron-containing alcohol dehydrogenase [Spirochaetia bacterium]
MDNSLSFETLNFTIPRIHFGQGRLREIPDLISSSYKNILIVTGKKSFRNTERFAELVSALKIKHRIQEMTVSGEPSPQIVDDAVKTFGSEIDLVLAIGGGSVLDASKAIAGLLPFGNSVMDHLEGVGKGIPYKGPAKPFIAVPTTAGTGSEATKNAVLSIQGPDGFKKSFR